MSIIIFDEKSYVISGYCLRKKQEHWRIHVAHRFALNPITWHTKSLRFEVTEQIYFRCLLEIDKSLIWFEARKQSYRDLRKKITSAFFRLTYFNKILLQIFYFNFKQWRNIMLNIITEVIPIWIFYRYFYFIKIKKF